MVLAQAPTTETSILKYSGLTRVKSRLFWPSTYSWPFETLQMGTAIMWRIFTFLFTHMRITTSRKKSSWLFAALHAMLKHLYLLCRQKDHRFCTFIAIFAWTICSIAFSCMTSMSNPFLNRFSACRSSVPLQNEKPIGTFSAATSNLFPLAPLELIWWGVMFGEIIIDCVKVESTLDTNQNFNNFNVGYLLLYSLEPYVTLTKTVSNAIFILYHKIKEPVLFQLIVLMIRLPTLWLIFSRKCFNIADTKWIYEPFVANRTSRSFLCISSLLTPRGWTKAPCHNIFFASGHLGNNA